MATNVLPKANVSMVASAHSPWKYHEVQVFVQSVDPRRNNVRRASYVTQHEFVLNQRLAVRVSIHWRQNALRFPLRPEAAKYFRGLTGTILAAMHAQHPPHLGR